MPANPVRHSLACLLAVCASACLAAQVACEVDYGGETRRISAAPTSTPYTVPTVQVGSYFLFRLVVERDTAVKVYVYADIDKIGPVPLHQATFPWPEVNQARHGFTGLHFVYEPVRDGELKYWCEVRP